MADPRQPGPWGVTMAHVAPRAQDEINELKPIFDNAAAAMGFVPNSMLTMAHMPQLPVVFSALANVVFGGDAAPLLERLAQIVPAQGDASANLPPELVQLIAYSVSLAAGCRYCQAHTSHSGHNRGAPEEQFQQVLNYETATCFSDAERAVIALALAAGQVPNGAEPEHFAALRAHFSERQIVQVVAVISMFGFLNRWNDTMATQLEAAPTAFAQATLGDGGWSAGKHGAG